MRKESVDHLTSIVVSSILEHGNSYLDHLPEMIKHWNGPLDDDNIFLRRALIVNFGKKNAEKIMGNLKDLVIHPLFDRDFFQGIIDGLGHKPDCRRLSFYFRPGLREFLESSEHNFNVKFGKSSLKIRNRTVALPFLSLSCKGASDQYFAGVLSSSVPFFDDGEVYCRVSNKCAGTLKKIGILYREIESDVLITPFYLMIFCGDLPVPIYNEWMTLLSKPEFEKMKNSSIDSLMNWRFVFGVKEFGADDLPYLRSRTYYYVSLGMTMKRFCEYMDEKQFDFVDERVRNRVKRWYNMRVPALGPISSSKLA